MPSAFRLRGFHPLRPAFPYPFRLALWSFSGSPYPGMLRIPVWALSISLAATLEITFVFFSSGYLDVSVRRVPLHNLLGLSPYSVMDAQGLPARVSPFRYLRITVYLPLPAAFRSLSRLSSAPSARASALCLSSLNPFLLDTPSVTCLSVSFLTDKSFLRIYPLFDVSVTVCHCSHSSFPSDVSSGIRFSRYGSRGSFSR